METEKEVNTSAWPDTPKTLLMKIRSGELEDSALWQRVDEMYRPVIEKFVKYKMSVSLRPHLADISAQIMWRLYLAVKGRNQKDEPVKGFEKKDGMLFRCYIATVARNIICDLWRKERLRGLERTVTYDEAFGDGAGIPDEDWEDVATYAAVAIQDGVIVQEFNDAGPSEEHVSERLEFDEAWIRSIVEIAVEESLAMPMPDERRAALRAVLLDREDPSAVAERFGVKENTISQWKSRIKKSVRALVKRYRDDDKSFGRLLAEKRPEVYRRLMELA